MIRNDDSGRWYGTMKAMVREGVEWSRWHDMTWLTDRLNDFMTSFLTDQPRPQTAELGRPSHKPVVMMMCILDVYTKVVNRKSDRESQNLGMMNRNHEMMIRDTWDDDTRSWDDDTRSWVSHSVIKQKLLVIILWCISSGILFVPWWLSSRYSCLACGKSDWPYASGYSLSKITSSFPSSKYNTCGLISTLNCIWIGLTKLFRCFLFNKTRAANPSIRLLYTAFEFQCF